MSMPGSERTDWASHHVASPFYLGAGLPFSSASVSAGRACAYAEAMGRLSLAVERVVRR